MTGKAMPVKPLFSPSAKSMKKVSNVSRCEAGTAHSNNIHKSFKIMFILGQIFGYLPVQGIAGPDYRFLRFRWTSFRVFYSVLTVLGACFLSCMQLHKMVVKGTDLSEIDRLCFELTGIVTGILFFNFAKSWPKLMKNWNTIEMSMASYGWPSGLNAKLNILTASFMVFALVEHILVQSNKLVLALECKGDVSEAFNYFLSNMSFSHIFSITEYNLYKALPIQAINLQLTFCWTFIDLFIMLISTALAFRFKQITTRVESFADAKIESQPIWKNLREDYDRLCKLCRKIDTEISYIVLMAFTSDLFFILIQLFNSLRPMRNTLERLYFYTSFGLLLVRTCCLCLYGAKVNDESKKPVVVLNSVSSSIYNIEIQRFIQQIGTAEVAITGRNFFQITRGLILRIAGAIVTYELVLIQFNDSLLKHTPQTIGNCPVFV